MGFIWALLHWIKQWRRHSSKSARHKTHSDQQDKYSEQPSSNRPCMRSVDTCTTTVPANGTITANKRPAVSSSICDQYNHWLIHHVPSSYETKCPVKPSTTSKTSSKYSSWSSPRTMRRRFDQGSSFQGQQAILVIYVSTIPCDWDSHYYHNLCGLELQPSPIFKQTIQTKQTHSTPVSYTHLTLPTNREV